MKNNELWGKEYCYECGDPALTPCNNNNCAKKKAFERQKLIQSAKLPTQKSKQNSKTKGNT